MNILRSKTFWFNVVSGLGLFLALPELTAVLPPEALRYIVLANAAINIALRRITTESVTFTGTGDGDGDSETINSNRFK